MNSFQIIILSFFMSITVMSVSAHKGGETMRVKVQSV